MSQDFYCRILQTNFQRKRRLKLETDNKVPQDLGRECQQLKLLNHIDELETIDNALFMMETSGRVDQKK